MILNICKTLIKRVSNGSFLFYANKSKVYGEIHLLRSRDEELGARYEYFYHKVHGDGVK